MVLYMSDQKKKYFHDTYFDKIMILLEENRFEEAIYEFQKYIEIYPNDLCGYIYYAAAWIKLGNFQEADRLLKAAIITKETPQASKEQYIRIKVNLLCGQNKYQECLELLSQNIDVFQKRNWLYYSTLLLLKKKLGILSLKDYQNAEGKYLYSQIVSYDEEKSISHIEKHISYDGNNNPCQFASDLPIRDIFKKLRESLPLENKIYYSDIANLYIFKHDACGHVNSKLVDFFGVIALKDSNDIITMYPYENRERRECIDLTPKIEDNPKVKRMSQIDKFNQRYGKKLDNH